MDRRLFLSLMTAGALCPTKDKYGLDILEQIRIEARGRKRRLELEAARRRLAWEHRHSIMFPSEIRDMEELVEKHGLDTAVLMNKLKFTGRH